MSWNPPPNGQPHHQNEWSNEEDDHEHPGGQSSEEDEVADYPHHHRYPEHPSANSHHPHQSQHPHHPQHPQHQQHQHSHHPQNSPPPHQIPQDHNPDHAMSYAEMYPFRIPPHQLAGFPHPHQQPAPRQRTAIACRYCRRRKIRCSGFESSPDGRCANCLRFNQECVFTPVSSQAQAFVPAHAAYPHMKQHQGMAGRGATGRASQPVLYGAHGQPLPSNYNSLPPPPPPPPPMDFHPPQQYPRPPSPGVGSSRQQPPPPPPPQTYNRSYEEQVAYEAERSRSQELHPPLLPPPVPGNPSQPHSLTRRGSAGDYSNRFVRNDPPSPSSHLVPPHHAYSPPPATGPPSAYSGPSYGQGPPPSISGNYYSSAQSSGPNSGQQRPRSPLGYHSPGDRSSGSPHPFHPPMQYPPPPRPTSSGPNPSSPSTHPIPSMQMANLIDPNNGPQSQSQNRNNQRSATDGDMLDKLRPRSGL